MGRPCGAGFFVRLLFLVRPLVRAEICGAGLLSAMRPHVLSGASRICAAALCYTGRLCTSARRGHLATFLSDPGMLPVRSI